MASRRRDRGPLSHRETQGPRQRVRGQLRRVQFSGTEPAELARDRADADRGRVEHRAVLRERHRRAAGRSGGPATTRLEARMLHAAFAHADGHADFITARPASGRSREPIRGQASAALRRGQMMLEREGVHPREDRRELLGGECV